MYSTTPVLVAGRRVGSSVRVAGGLSHDSEPAADGPPACRVDASPVAVEDRSFVALERRPSAPLADLGTKVEVERPREPSNRARVLASRRRHTRDYPRLSRSPRPCEHRPDQSRASPSSPVAVPQRRIAAADLFSARLRASPSGTCSVLRVRASDAGGATAPACPVQLVVSGSAILTRADLRDCGSTTAGLRWSRSRTAGCSTTAKTPATAPRPRPEPHRRRTRSVAVRPRPRPPCLHAGFRGWLARTSTTGGGGASAAHRPEARRWTRAPGGTRPRAVRLRVSGRRVPRGGEPGYPLRACRARPRRVAARYAGPPTRRRSGYAAGRAPVRRRPGGVGRRG